LIAPLRQIDRDPPSTGLQRARRAVATLLFERNRRRPSELPTWPRWKAWLFVAWLALVLSAYAASMLNFF
jgi:hypothetical protein